METDNFWCKQRKNLPSTSLHNIETEIGFSVSIGQMTRSVSYFSISKSLFKQLVTTKNSSYDQQGTRYKFSVVRYL